MEVRSCLKVEKDAMIWAFDRVGQGNKAPKKGAAPSNNKCYPIKFANKLLQVNLGTFVIQACTLEKR